VLAVNLNRRLSQVVVMGKSADGGNGVDDGIYRIWHIIGCKMRGLEPLIPVGTSTFWAGGASGRFPAGIKLSSKMTVWRKKDILDWLANPTSPKTVK